VNLRIAILAVALCSPMSALVRFSGYCQQGGKVVTINSGLNSGAQKFQQSFPGASLYVYLTGTVTQAAIYSDSSGTTLSQPLTCNSTGYFYFYAPTGSYDEAFFGNGVAVPFTLGDISQVGLKSIPAILNVTDSPYKAKCDGATDDAGSVLSAIAAAPSGSTIYFPPTLLGCKVGSLGIITKLLTFDFGGGLILPATNGAWLTTSFIGDQSQFIFKNATFQQAAGFTPTDIFVLDGQPNSSFEYVNFYAASATHAFVWNRASYGTSLGYVHIRDSTITGGGCAIYASFAAAGDFSQFTFTMSIIHSDLSNNAATGICIEGGELSIKDTIVESQSLGCIEHRASSTVGWRLEHLELDGVHSESCGIFNIKLPATSTGNVNTPITSNVTIRHSYFSNSPNIGGLATSKQWIILGAKTLLTIEKNETDSCVDTGATLAGGYISPYGNTVFGTPAGCSVALGYQLSSALSNGVDFCGNTIISLTALDPSCNTSNPFKFINRSGTPGAHIVEFRSTTGVVGYPTTDGDLAMTRDMLPGRDMIASRYFGSTNVSHTWKCVTEYNSSDSDLSCYYDGIRKIWFDNTGGIRTVSTVNATQIVGSQAPLFPFVRLLDFLTAGSPTWAGLQAGLTAAGTPCAAGSNAGMIAYVINGNNTGYGNIVNGAGGNSVLIVCDGNNWRVH
jgi:hypothetical protein